MPAKAKEFRYAIGLDRTGRVTADGQSPLDLDEAWTPEHLVLVPTRRRTLCIRRDRRGARPRARAGTAGGGARIAAGQGGARLLRRSVAQAVPELQLARERLAGLALERRHGQAVALQLLPVVLRHFLVA